MSKKILESKLRSHHYMVAIHRKSKSKTSEETPKWRKRESVQDIQRPSARKSSKRAKNEVSDAYFLSHTETLQETK
jgi:hypothetical protein